MSEKTSLPTKPVKRKPGRPRVYPGSEKQAIMDYFYQHGVTKAAKKFGVSSSLLYYWKNRDGIEPSNGTLTPTPVQTNGLGHKAWRYCPHCGGGLK